MKTLETELAAFRKAATYEDDSPATKARAEVSFLAGVLSAVLLILEDEAGRSEPEPLGLVTRCANLASEAVVRIAEHSPKVPPA